MYIDIKTLIGQTFDKVENQHDEQIVFFQDGKPKYIM